MLRAIDASGRMAAAAAAAWAVCTLVAGGVFGLASWCVYRLIVYNREQRHRLVDAVFGSGEMGVDQRDLLVAQMPRFGEADAVLPDVFEHVDAEYPVVLLIMWGAVIAIALTVATLLIVIPAWATLREVGVRRQMFFPAVVFGQRGNAVLPLAVCTLLVCVLYALWWHLTIADEPWGAPMFSSVGEAAIVGVVLAAVYWVAMLRTATQKLAHQLATRSGTDADKRGRVCLRCGYPCDAATPRVCPECGNRLDRAARVAPFPWEPFWSNLPSTRGLGRAGIAAGLLVGAVLALWPLARAELVARIIAVPRGVDDLRELHFRADRGLEVRMDAGTLWLVASESSGPRGEPPVAVYLPLRNREADVGPVRLRPETKVWRTDEQTGFRLPAGTGEELAVTLSEWSDLSTKWSAFPAGVWSLTIELPLPIRSAKFVPREAVLAKLGEAGPEDAGPE